MDGLFYSLAVVEGRHATGRQAAKMETTRRRLGGKEEEEEDEEEDEKDEKEAISTSPPSRPSTRLSSYLRPTTPPLVARPKKHLPAAS